MSKKTRSQVGLKVERWAAEDHTASCNNVGGRLQEPAHGPAVVLLGELGQDPG
ncbi:hypothetical protein [Kitasatospora sp. NPDC050543]|uniref:hypothetical protein n=1 Tax=Kitasatospora sp. NPDC050543 TaxID=3364054 RepID=UPI0037A9624A